MPSAYLRSVSAQALARILYVASGTVVFIVVARLLGPGELGRYALVVNLQSIAIAAADLGTTSLLARDLVASGAARRSYLGSFILFRLMLGCAVAAVAAALAFGYAPAGLQAALVTCAVLVPLNAARFFDPVLQYVGRPYLSAGLSAAYAVLLPTATWVALSAPGERAASASIAFATAGAVYGLAGILLALWALRPQFGLRELRRLPRIVAGALPLGAIGILSMLTLRLDVLLVDWLGGSDMLGLYNAAFRFFDLGVAVIVTLLTPLVPILSQLAIEQRDRLMTACAVLFRLSATVGVFVTLVAVHLAPPLLGTLYGPAFGAAAPALSLLAAKLAIGTLNLLLISCLMTITPIGRVWLGSAAGLAVNLLLNLVLIPRYGLTGAAVAALACELPPVMVTCWFVRRAGFRLWGGGWVLRLGCATVAGLVGATLADGPLLRAALSAVAFGATLQLLAGWPRNPLPLLQGRPGSGAGAAQAGLVPAARIMR